ncbi:tRNA pseudouridine(38-40) synthase TruA [Methanofollis fontis]|uniref:tRNA pseudouridine synthase A n=1 Tax=Methanofollis fontis TaxID=2052832 RepID=A0A483CR66_9EURY|nr:tRNA pseudouridine(38-40) synthase TruA [Methanofollis fontis]TAJ45605.1 tRNA pseudouridine(38-40) synthase TruA [Methanofollis fontis]
MRCAFRIGYWGEQFFGSQVQPDVRTVEGEVAAACRRLGLFDDPKEAGFTSAGRTDRGVHAAAQVVAFTTDLPGRAVAALPHELPKDIWCTGWAAVHDRFNPRKEALARTYRYYFGEHPGDLAAMNRAAALFVGEHDFTLFSRKSERSPIRRVLATSVAEEEGACVFQVTAESFLWNMVRCMAGALDAVGRGECGADGIADLLTGRGGRRPAAAPPHGLILTDVDYGFAFTPVRPSRKAMAALENRGRELRQKEGANRELHRFCLDVPREQAVDDELRHLP